MLNWLAVHTEMKIPAEARDVAAASFNLNLAVQQRRLKETRRMRFA